MDRFGDHSTTRVRALLPPPRAMSFRTIGLTITVLALVACTATGVQVGHRGMGGRGGGYGQQGQRGGQAPGARRAASNVDAGEHRTLVVNGVTRDYYFHRPANASASLPLVIVYHGGGGDASKIAAQTGFNEVADRNGFAVVYPNAIDHWNDGRDSTAGFGDDTRFTSELINELATRDGIDRARVYATGASNGGMMTLRAACERANEIAAFAVVAASFPDTYMSRCKPARSVPIMIIHGTQDPLVPEQGATVQGGTRRLGGTITPLKDTLDFWRRTDRCQAAPSPQTLPDKSNDGTSVQVSDYQGCATNSKLVFVNVTGGGHTWPDERIATNPKAGRVTHDIDGTQYVWDFFKNYSLSGSR